MIAPCIGPHMRSHSMGGPACRRVRLPRPGMALCACSTPVSTGWAERKRSKAVRFAASTSGSLTRMARRIPMSRSPAAGGRQSSWMDCPPVWRIDSAKEARPILITCKSCSKSLLTMKGLPQETIAAASRAAWALLSVRRTPASASSDSCRERLCGSDSVPHTEPTKIRLRFAFVARLRAS